MTSQKAVKYLMSSPPVSSSARFRSPGIVRRNIIGDSGFQSAQFAKKSRRSKSSEANSREISSNVLSGKRKLSKPHENAAEDHMEALNNRWRMMAKNQEMMTKDEIMVNYKLLLTDHIKLEKFMSLVSRENELNRTRLESDLLDSMMLIEDLKQSLEARSLHRNSRMDPRDSEERRELIRQNKKLLNELHESAKKIEKMEILIFELQEQVELADFQMMEVQNQKIIMEEQMGVGRDVSSVSCQATDFTVDVKIESLTKERDIFRSNYNNSRCEHNQMAIEMKSIQDDNEVLKISEENLQEELVCKANEICSLKKDISALEDRIKNSVNEASRGVVPTHVNCVRNYDEDSIMFGSDDFDELSTASDSGFEVTESLYHGDQGSHLLADTVKMLCNLVKEKEEEINKLKAQESPLPDVARLSSNLYNRYDSGFCNETQGQQSPSGACCSSFYKVQQLEIENRRWKSFVENVGKAESELLHVIADLEETVRNNKLTTTSLNASPQRTGINSDRDRTADYFSRRLADIQLDHTEDQMEALLTEAERAKDVVYQQLHRLEAELEASNGCVERLDTELTSTKKIELTLRRRIENLEQRVMSLHNGCSTLPMKPVMELETKITQLETINSSLIEVNSLEKRRMEEQRTRINELEQTKMALTDKLNIVQTKELMAQKKINRLQGVYEDLLREYSALRAPPQDKVNVNAAVVDENKRLRCQLKELKDKYEELQSLIIRYQRHLIVDGRPIGNSNSINNKLSTPIIATKSFISQMRDLTTK